MKILILTNLYPPHDASLDRRCERTLNHLRARGHHLRVLAAHADSEPPRSDAEIDRKLSLHGAGEHSQRLGYRALRKFEIQNHRALREVIAEFQPQLIYVWSLHGLPKSLAIALGNSAVSTVYDVSDRWIVDGIRSDPWLRWWNQPRPPLLRRWWRAVLEATGRRSRIEALAPTQSTGDLNRLPALYGSAEEIASAEPNAINVFRFDHIFFPSQALKHEAVGAGLRVAHAEVIPPGVPTGIFTGEIEPASTPLRKLLIVSQLDAERGIPTAMKAMGEARRKGLPVSLSLCGPGAAERVAYWRSFVARHELPVEFVPVPKTDDDLAALYRAHDAFLYTAEWDEPFAVQPLEAMACGLPVIYARIGGVREVLHHGENAMAFTSDNVTDLVARIQELNRDSRLRCRIAAKGQADVRNNFDERNILERIENYLTSAVKE